VTTASYSLTVSDGDAAAGPLVATITELAPAPAVEEKVEDAGQLVLTAVAFDSNKFEIIEAEASVIDEEGIPLKITVENPQAVTASVPAPVQANIQNANDKATAEPERAGIAAPVLKANPLLQLNSIVQENISLFDNVLMKISGFESTGIDTIKSEDSAQQRDSTERHFEQALKALRQQLGETTEEELSNADQIIVAAKSIGMALSVGSVSWLLRVEWLFSFLVTTIPAWQRFDPLPVLTSQRPNTASSSAKDDTEEEKAKALREEAIEEQAGRILDGRS
jgi:hypothetical protein